MGEKMEPKISVIIPVYNVEKYLEKCIKSVISQEYKNLEIILVNDGSTDKSGEICDNYKLIDDRIKVMHKKNGGLSDARNCGLDNARGEYIAFLDSDDWIDKKLYSSLYNIINKYDADIAICNFKKVYKENEELNNIHSEFIYSNVEVLENILSKIGTQMIVSWNKLYKREVLKNMRFPVGKIHEDEFLTPMILYKANRIVYTEKELIYYRQRENSIMGSGFTNRSIDILHALDIRSDFYLKNNLFSLYEKNLRHQLDINIDFYYKIKNSDIQNKTQLYRNLSKSVLKIKKRLNNKLSAKDKFRIGLFIVSPTIYDFATNLKKI